MEIGNIASAYSDLYASTTSQSASKLEGKLNTDYTNATDEELMGACKEFEAYFLEQMFKQMWKTIPKSEESAGANATLAEYWQDELIQNMSEESTNQNSLGLAQMLYEQMKRNIV